MIYYYRPRFVPTTINFYARFRAANISETSQVAVLRSVNATDWPLGKLTFSHECILLKFKQDFDL